VPEFRIISIGALAAHPLRGESRPCRTGHGTSVLLTAPETREAPVLLVDPGLPDVALRARLEERAGLEPRHVTHIFLTSFHPDLRRGLPLFDHATWWIAEREREEIGRALIERYRETEDELGPEDETTRLLRDEIAVLRRCTPAPDEMLPRVAPFPLPGRTPGSCGVLVAQPRFTILLAGDAIPTREHLEQGKVLPDVQDVEAARESFLEAVEIADLIVPGRDDLVVNPTRRPF